MPHPRLTTELDLLTAIYPSQITHTPHGSLKFTQDTATLDLRIPDTYPSSGHPDVLGATDLSKSDIRTQTRNAVKALALPDGEESLDAVIAAFCDVLSSRAQERARIAPVQPAEGGDASRKTVIIWLHHLLATSKRKLCIAPPLSGVSKPGYPGVLVYSGPRVDVDAHVAELRAQNWAAFQVRFEEDVEWVFGHGGVKEVESMGDVVKLVGGVEGERGQRQREELLKAVGIK